MVEEPRVGASRYVRFSRWRLATASVGAIPVNADPPINECDIVGTAGDDFICGSFSCEDDDAFAADPRVPETICGLGGNDTIDVGPGDRVFGGPGRDRLYHGAVAQSLHGGDGDDLLSSCMLFCADPAFGAALLFGGTGDDRLVGEHGPDRLHGGPGRGRTTAASRRSR